jgi:hypothetical protein
MQVRKLLLITTLFLGGACSADRSLGVTTAEPNLTPELGAQNAAPKFWETGATVAWNEHAANLIARRPADAVRTLAYLSLAQYRAAEAAKAMPGPHPPIGAAIAGASVVVLRAFFPPDVADIDGWLAQQASGPMWPGAKHQDFVAGEALGRAVGEHILAFAQTDAYNSTDPGLPPIGADKWVYVSGPIARGGLGARPFFLTSYNQFLPPPPPAYLSPAFNAALAEVKQISDTRTAEQLSIAQYWNVNQSPRSAEAMNGIARGLIVDYRQKDDVAARTMFLLNASAFDAVLGCFQAKFTYWFLRPSMADGAITLPIGLPPHPSYPSAHSCISGASTGVLAALFPSQAASLEATALEASLSRVYGGIHYRFDAEAGRSLGRGVAGAALAADLAAIAPLP